MSQGLINDVANHAARTDAGGVKDEQPVAPPSARHWTTPGDYVGAMARKRTARRGREPGPRTQSDAPRAMWSTIPFIALLAVLAVLAVAIMVLAWPGNQEPAYPHAAAHEIGTAEKGWFQEAQKEMQNR